MKLPFKKRDPSKPRPYWHVDAKWICGLLLLASLALTLPVAAAHRLTSKDASTELVAYALAGLTSPEGIDNDAGLEDIKKQIKEEGSQTVKFGGVEIVFTAEDVNNLSPRELRLKVFTTFAEEFYEQGAKELAESQGFGAEAAEKFEKDAALVNALGADAHNAVGKVLFWLIVADILLLAGVVYFSRRFGRLVSPGLILLLVGLPGIIFAAIAAQNPEVAGAARSEDPESQFALIGQFASFAAPLVMPHLAFVYLWALIPGVSLLVLAGLGRIVYAILGRRKGKHEAHAHKPESGATD